ncbi:hypothetical protein GCM10023188_35920 [Pontibacter saemangeumensis]|uniref:Glycosyltransferase 2-like domain-containing protein n=1 Tax=Pontibacter saemangeumensis TaxID=1084525 RepID=A0ABP8LZA0_9BACT
MKVSVCIPTYNQAQFVSQAVRSAFKQTVAPYEVIVSDDCSTDETYEVLTNLAKEVSDLKIVRQPFNLGISGNTDYCLRLATGDFVIRLDSDDYLSPNYVKKLGELLLQYPDAGYAHAAVQEIDQEGKLLNKRILFRSSGFQSGIDALRSAKDGYRVAANIIMFRRSALVKVGYVTERPDYVEDYHLSAALAAAGFGNIYLNETLSYYRVWVDAGNVRQRRKLMEIKGLQKVMDEILEPAYQQRGWDLTILKKKRSAFACRQADCLAWDIYTAKEKAELMEALKTLSSSTSLKWFSWLYSNGFGDFLVFYSKCITFSKTCMKAFLISFKV